MKKCPYCAEQIQDEAVICRYCKKSIPKKERVGFWSKVSQTGDALCDAGNKIEKTGNSMIIWGILILLFLFFVLKGG